MQTSDLAPERLVRLIDAGRGLMEELDPELVLDRLLETARELTGARYAALGILDEQREALARFITRGVDEATHRAIGELPRGRGILGLLIEDARPLRLHDIGEHPRSFGLPVGHPRMRTFLGVPVLVRGRAWGNLYLTEKAGGEAGDLEHHGGQPMAHEVVNVAGDPAPLHQQRLLRELAPGGRELGDELGLAACRAAEDPRKGDAEDPDPRRDLGRILDQARDHGGQQRQQAQRYGFGGR